MSKPSSTTSRRTSRFLRVSTRRLRRYRTDADGRRRDARGYCSCAGMLAGTRTGGQARQRLEVVRESGRVEQEGREIRCLRVVSARIASVSRAASLSGDLSRARSARRPKSRRSSATFDARDSRCARDGGGEHLGTRRGSPDRQGSAATGLESQNARARADVARIMIVRARRVSSTRRCRAASRYAHGVERESLPSARSSKKRAGFVAACADHSGWRTAREALWPQPAGAARSDMREDTARSVYREGGGGRMHRWSCF